MIMIRNLEELFLEAAQLPERDRATLAGLLIESLEPAPEADVEAAWSKEIERRVAELDAGTVETISWEEAVEFCALATYLAEMIGHAHKLSHGENPKSPAHRSAVH